jgi:tRNA-splicing ligase RtcB (3'-phosphate/5'-hydroxy nucleic acid ligase)
MTDQLYDYLLALGGMSEGPRFPIKGWTRGVPVEEEALRQLQNVASLPFIHEHVAVMPDVHWGQGATVGSVIATKGAIVPAAVGVDIGCGMMALRTSLVASDLPDNLAPLRSAIEAAVPHGRTDNGGANDRGAWGTVPAPVASRFEPLYRKLFGIVIGDAKLTRAAERAHRHLGTLGTGNHFIELCLDEEQRVWIMLHSGSRGIGNAIGQHFIAAAKKDMQRWFINLPDADLAYIPEGSALFGDYWRALTWAQEYATLNRQLMMAATAQALECITPGKAGAYDLEAVNCHHNYVSRERHFGDNVLVTRKGAVSAQEGELGIIPGSMGAKSFIVRGKGNREAFCSCSHGAGRRMSRGDARRLFTLEDHAVATAGVECRKDAEVLDETPGAYKDIDAVMAAQTDLVDVVHTLKQVLCVKG